MRPLELMRDAGRTMLVLEDAGGEPLDRLLGVPMEIGPFLRLGGIAAALGKLHQRGLVHKDIKPANILVNGATGHVWLTGSVWLRACRASASRLSPRDDRRDAGLHGARADWADEPLGRFAQRPLRAGRDLLRNAHRQLAVHRGRPDGVGALPSREAAVPPAERWRRFPAPSLRS